MKVLWNWKNIAKTATVLVTFSVGWALFLNSFAIPEIIAVLLGALIGFIVVQVAMVVWPNWRFEE